MKSQYDYFEFREVTEEDEFNWDKLGLLAPVKVHSKNDWKFGFAYDCETAKIPIDYYKHLLKLITFGENINCINFVVRKIRRSGDENKLSNF